MKRPGIIISALRGGAGKTFISLSIVTALRQSGLSVSPFKKGPDYIDAGWLALAAGRPCHNLDTFLIPKETVLQSFLFHAKNADISVIEGNRGLYDGIDIEGSTSTAELAKLIKKPVVLCIDCTKTTRTMAAVVKGCMLFDPEAVLKGVILNRIAGPRHEANLRSNIEHHCGIPVVGAIPKLKQQSFPERHMGLVPSPEHEWARNSLKVAGDVAKKYIDLGWMIEMAEDHEKNNQGTSDKNFFTKKTDPKNGAKQSNAFLYPFKKKTAKIPTIGIIRDSAFQFYYPENIEALSYAGAKTIFISPLVQKRIPDLDGLYIGGGFPETHAETLSENKDFGRSLKQLAEEGLPIYAECGGLMYLGEELILGQRTYPMAGILPISYTFSKKPQGHGYTILKVEKDNPYYKKGTLIHGHEFHYSKVSKWAGTDDDLAFKVERGVGFHHKRDGVLYKNVLAAYTHVHALGIPEWAESLVQNAALYRKGKKQ